MCVVCSWRWCCCRYCYWWIPFVRGTFFSRASLMLLDITTVCTLSRARPQDWSLYVSEGVTCCWHMLTIAVGFGMYRQRNFGGRWAPRRLMSCWSKVDGRGCMFFCLLSEVRLIPCVSDLDKASVDRSSVWSVPAMLPKASDAGMLITCLLLLCSLILLSSFYSLSANWTLHIQHHFPR